MLQMLRTLCNDNSDDWDLLLSFVVMAYNSTLQESTGLSPRLMEFGDEMPITLDKGGKAPGREGV